MNHLLLNNPMNHEAVRVGRRFLRTGGDTGKMVNTTILGILGLLYIWLLIAVVRYHEDMTTMILLMELGILTLAVPASMYAAVSGERERLTWDALIMTRLSPAQIVVGKLLWRALMVVGLMALFVPPLLLCHFAGGALADNGYSRGPEYSVSGMWVAQGIILMWSLLLCAFSLFVSAKTRRAVTTLSVITIALLAFLALVPTLLSLFGGRVEFYRVGRSPLEAVGSLLVHLNPFYAITTLRLNQGGVSDADFSHGNVVWYGIATFLLLFGAWRTLRGLEAPASGKNRG